MTEPLIVGAGMAGCIAAYMIPDAKIIERHKSPPDNHRAVLRFRDESVSQVTGIPFRKVKVHKGIYHQGAYQQPNPQLANLYSQKVVGGVYDRSIWNLDTVERYVAPTDFHMQMLRSLSDRIYYEVNLTNELLDLRTRASEPTISTMPMNRMAEIVGYVFPDQFNFRNTISYNATIEKCDSHFTVYYPGRDMSAYRASVTGNRLIVESMGELWPHEKDEIAQSLGIKESSIMWDESEYKSTYGKIAEVNEAERKAFIMYLTLEHNLFSLGRFGTWRNILLDDVVSDVNAIKGMIQNGIYQTMIRNGHAS